MADPTFEGEIAGGAPPLLHPGEYSLRAVHWRTMMLFGRQPKLALWFKLVDFGEEFDTIVPRYYNVRRVIGQPRKNGPFQAGWRSDLIVEYATLLKPPRRNDRIALSAYFDRIVIGEVETVTTGAQQQALPAELHYSVVRKLLRCTA